MLMTLVLFFYAVFSECPTSHGQMLGFSSDVSTGKAHCRSVVQSNSLRGSNGSYLGYEQSLGDWRRYLDNNKGY